MPRFGARPWDGDRRVAGGDRAMSVFLRSSASLLVARAPVIAAMLMLAAVPSRADELVVMPYSCAVVGGELMLTPSPDTGHRIIGAREQRTFTACSPQNTELYRRWTVYRSDVDRDCVRVPCLSIPAIADTVKRPRLLAVSEDGH